MLGSFIHFMNSHSMEKEEEEFYQCHLHIVQTKQPKLKNNYKQCLTIIE